MKLRALFGTMVVLSTLLVALATPTVAVAETAPCGGDDQNHVGTYYDSGLDIKGVKAAIDPLTATFQACSTFLGDDGPSAWVALEPGLGTGKTGIIQVGIVNCNSPLYDVCDGPWDEPHYFWAAGGCGFPAAPVDLGATGFGVHSYSISRRGSDGDYDIVVDGTRRHVVDSSHFTVQCWINGDKKAVWSGETWDKGDGFADSSNRLNFTGMGYQTATGGGWNNPNFYDNAPCPIIEDSTLLNHECRTESGGNKMDLWSVRK